MVGSCIGIMVLAFLYEGLRLLKMKVGERGKCPRCVVSSSDNKSDPSKCCSPTEIQGEQTKGQDISLPNEYKL